ncbi:hypothetical protein ALP47_01718 [Pseudomonas savastanoi]|nr:hypothetical protein ALP47_01718 [Pseudomonas savastanoi]
MQPEDIALEAQSLLKRARKMEPRVTHMLRRVAESHAGQLAGMDHQLKSVGSLKENLKQQMAVKNKTLEEAVAGVNDALRYSVVLDPQDFTAGLRGVLASLDDQGHVRVKLNNLFAKHQPAFKSVNVTMRSPEGALWEIQFHTPDTFRLKEQFHDLYKHSYALQLQGAPLTDQREVQAPAQDAFRLVPSPPECDDIDDWEEENVPALAIMVPAFKSQPNNRKDAAKFRAGVSSTPQVALSQQRAPTRFNANASPAQILFDVAASKQESLTPVWGCKPESQKFPS